MSCILITLNKCLKGHKSLGSLCNVKSKSTVSQWVSQWVSEWQGHLLSCCGQLKINTYLPVFAPYFHQVWNIDIWLAVSCSIITLQWIHICRNIQIKLSLHWTSLEYADNLTYVDFCNTVHMIPEKWENAELYHSFMQAVLVLSSWWLLVGDYQYCN